MEAFEVMMNQIESDCGREKLLLDDLKARGRERSATYRQFLGNRLMYTKFLAIYQACSLLE